MQKELVERRKILHEHFHPVEGEFGFAQSSDGSSSEQIAEFLDDSIKDGCEGLMVKRLTTEDSTYEPSRRSINWLKVSDTGKELFEVQLTPVALLPSSRRIILLALEILAIWWLSADTMARGNVPTPTEPSCWLVTTPMRNNSRPLARSELDSLTKC